MSIGCKVNQYEVAAIAELFRARGYAVVDWRDRADVYVVHTCAVTQTAEQKCRRAIRQAAARNPGAVVAVSGCYAELFPKEIAAIPGVSVVAGTADISSLVDRVENPSGRGEFVPVRARERRFEEISACSFRERTRALLKIEDGCDQFCTYCVVPRARGPVRSRPLDGVVREARQLVQAGYREIVLTGVRLGAYGRDLRGGVRLRDAVMALCRLEGLGRLRLSSLEVGEVDGDIVEMMASSGRICRHLHIPLQSGDDRVLGAMGRPYRTRDYAAVVEAVRRRVPDVAITTDVMVGFPGESDEEFARTCAFVDEMGFSRLHVFRFSRREGTPASSFPGQVPERVKESRAARLISLGKELALAYHRRFVGRMLPVLFERSSGDGHLEGLSDNYIRVVAPLPSSAAGKIVDMVVTRAGVESVVGELASVNGACRGRNAPKREDLRVRL